MRKILLLLTMIAFSASFSQTISNSFIIKNNKQPNNQSFFEESISKANMETYRLRDENVMLTFDNGFTLELLSAKALFLKGISININNYEISYPSNSMLPTFTILPDGYLIGRVSTTSKK